MTSASSTKIVAENASLLPDAPLPNLAENSNAAPAAVSSAFSRPISSTEQSVCGRFCKTTNILAYSGGRSVSEFHGKLGMIHAASLIVNRGASSFDGYSTYKFLDLPSIPPYTVYAANGSETAYGGTDAIPEGDPLLTLFGDRSKFGVLASGAVLQTAYDYGNAHFPRLVEKRFGKKGKVAATVAMIALNGWSSQLHIRYGVHNLKNIAWWEQNQAYYQQALATH